MGWFVTRELVARIDKKACKWSLSPSLFTFDNLLDDRREELFNRSDHCLHHLLPPVSELYLYSFPNRIHSSAVPLVRTELHKNSFVISMLSQFGVE